MIFIAKPAAVDALYVDYQRAGRQPETIVATAQEWCPTTLRIVEKLPNLGPKSLDEFQEVFAAEAMHGNWYRSADTLKNLIEWCRSNKMTGYAAFRKQLKTYTKQRDTSAAVMHLITQNGVQRRPAAFYAMQSPGHCAGCQADIDKGEWYNEAEDKFWHSMCTPLDKLVVGHLLDSEENKIKDILLSEEPTATEWIERIT